MKTVKQVLKENSQHAKLIKAVLKQLGDPTATETVPDLVRYPNADAGWSGFIYYSDTHEFAMKNRKAINELLKDTADQLGEEVVSMVKNFGVFKGEMDNEELQDLYKYIGGGRPKQGSVTNIMAWFALEEVARMFDN
jgi:hypothetical protein